MADHLLLIRSGATDYDLQRRIRGTLDMPLATVGVGEAERAAAEAAAARPTALLTSPDSCAVETARIVGRSCGLRPRVMPGLGNLDQGLWQGLLIEEIRRKQPRLCRQWQEHPWSVAPPEGELLEDAVDRVREALDRLARRPAGVVAVVVPRPLDRIVRWLVADEPLGDLWTEEPAHPPTAVLPLASRPRPARRPTGAR